MNHTNSTKLKAAIKVLLGALLLCSLIFAVRNSRHASVNSEKHEQTQGNPAVTGPSASTASTSIAQEAAKTPISAAIDTASAEKTKAVETGCFLANYHHKELTGHKNPKDCALHKNYIHLKATGLNTKSVCVRLNGTPVAYEFVQEKGSTGISGIMLGAIAGPDSKISVRYCLGVKKCNEECKIPNDEFMDAIGGTNPDADSKVPVVKWDPTDAASESDAVAEVDSELQKELTDADLSVFEGWIGNDEAISCKERLAQKN